MQTTLRSTILASAILGATALPAAAAPQGPPSIIMNTEQAYVMAPLTAYAAAGGGVAGGTVTMRNGLPGNMEWWLSGMNLNINPFSIGTGVGAKYQYMQTGGGMAGAIFGTLMPQFNTPAGGTGTFGLGADVGLAFSQSLTFGNFSFSPNLNFMNLTSAGGAGMMMTLDPNLALIVPLGGGWLGTIEDIPAVGLNGGGFQNHLGIGGRFVPANNTTLDVKLISLDGSNFTGGLLSVTGWVGW